MTKNGVISEKLVHCIFIFWVNTFLKHPVVFFSNQTVWQYFDGYPANSKACRAVWKKSRFRPISLYLRNDRYKMEPYYYGVRMENRTEAFERYHFQWPWVILSDVAKYSITRSIARSPATTELLVRFLVNGGHGTDDGRTDGCNA